MTKPPNRPLLNLRQGRTVAHRRLRLDLICAALLVFAVGLSCGGGFFQGMVLGALLMFLPRLWTSINAVLDLEVVWDRFGPPPRRVGKHHSGHHPRPDARNPG